MAGRRVLRIEIGTLEKTLWCNYKNVRGDVRALEALGIVDAGQRRTRPGSLG